LSFPYLWENQLYIVRLHCKTTFPLKWEKPLYFFSDMFSSAPPGMCLFTVNRSLPFWGSELADESPPYFTLFVGGSPFHSSQLKSYFGTFLNSSFASGLWRFHLPLFSLRCKRDPPSEIQPARRENRFYFFPLCEDLLFTLQTNFPLCLFLLKTHSSLQPAPLRR